MPVTPAVVLAALVGSFHTGLYLFLTGRVGFHTVMTLIAAVLGAWAGDAVAGMLGVDPIRIGDFRVLAASGVAWAGIAFVETLLVLGPTGPVTPGPAARR